MHIILCGSSSRIIFERLPYFSKRLGTENNYLNCDFSSFSQFEFLLRNNTIDGCKCRFCKLSCRVSLFRVCINKLIENFCYFVD